MGYLMDFRPPFFRGASSNRKATHGAALGALWRLLELPEEALDFIDLPGADPVLPSSFPVGMAAQYSMGAAALAAAEIWHLRGGGKRQRVTVDMRHAAQETRGFYTLNGVPSTRYDKITGVYRCADDNWVRIHANFAHHRDGALALLGCPTGATVDRRMVEKSLARWNSFEFEQAAADAGLVVAAMRSFDEWDRHPQGIAVSQLPVISIERIGDAPPLALPSYGADPRPLKDIRVLDLTRILAGPVGGRTLAAYGADVMLLNSPNLPNIDAIAETSRGKLSVHADLDTATGRITLGNLLRSAHIFTQAYRPGALADLGFSVEDVARIRPGIVCVSLSAYGHVGPWAGRRGFDSLVQTASGFNHAEAKAANQEAPKPLPTQILDYATGYLMACGAQAALIRQATEGGSWHVRVSLAQTGRWLRGLPRQQSGLGCPLPPLDPYLETTDSGFGRLTAVRHAARFSVTPARWARPSVPPGTHPTVWPFS
ncbi:CoA transferase [Bordetella sp. N]|uniref:CoA transferase n=1 Tax=Bordetella sp. N TaxID=1746199 RepID=UPI00070D2AD2|nr:CoA transferase [Bordetella sp. N]ALM82563.1 carnitine dehydratase [Bordetella sp. N]